VHPLPRLIYNPSDSVAVGWYRVDPLGHGAGSLPRPLSVGSIVLTTLPPEAAALAAQRGYLPARVPLLKRVGAIAPQEVCITGRTVRIDGVPSAAVLPADRWGRPLPSWQQCRRLRTRRTVPAQCDQPGIVRQPVFRAGQRIRRDRRRASGLAGVTPMMAADFAARCRASHRAIGRVVPVAFAVSSRVQCERIRAALRAAFGAAVPCAGVLPRTRPACGRRRVRRRAGCSRSSAAGPPLPGAPARGKGGRQDKRTRHRAASKASLHVGVARHGAASPPCRVGREARANAGMSACFARPDTPELAGSAAMTDRRDDDFRIRPSAPKNRGQGFVSKVLKQAGKASGGKSSVRRPGTAGGTGRGTGQRPGSRLGRGHTAARFAGAKLTPMSRRVTIKTLLVNQRQASPQSLAKHLRYIERDGVGRDGEPGQAYGPQTDAADLDAFKERCADDRHHFRFILSPEDGAELEDLRTYTRHLMGRMEADLGTGLDWVAVNHWNTDNPHTHIVVRGRDDTGKDLIIAGDYIADGFRHRAAELATEWLGPRTELEIQQTLQREVEQERWTSLDRTLQREAGDDGRCMSNAQRTAGCNASACC
jgi:hypothetical protein